MSKSKKHRVAKSSHELKLDLGSGEKPKEGFVGVDLHAVNPEILKVDLTKFPWPWEDESVSEVHCSHFIEHLPMVYVEPDGSYSHVPSASGVDLLIKFFNELYRILSPEGTALIICPAAQSSRAFQDPTHRRFIVGETFFYTWRKFRVENGLEHYLHATCDFDFNVNTAVVGDNAGRSEEVQRMRANTLWNVIMDFHVTMTKANRIPTIPQPMSLVAAKG